MSAPDAADPAAGTPPPGAVQVAAPGGERLARGSRPRVVILGGGFAGLQAARALRGAPVDVVVIDRTNHHLFQPLLYQVATAGLTASQIASPIRHLLRKQANARVVLAEVEAIDAAARSVDCGSFRVGYDYLIVATGVTHSWFGNDHWAPHAPGLKTLGDALEIRRRVLLAYERAETAASDAERREWLTFVVVGAGPTGVELAGTLAEIAQHTLSDQFRSFESKMARVVLVEGADAVLAAFGPKLAASARRELEGLGVEVRLSAPVTHVDAEGVVAGGEHIASRTVVWAAGVRGSPVAASLPARFDSIGRVHVAPALHLPGNPAIFVLGDLAALEHDGQPLPGVAQVAIQGGRHAALCIGQLVAGTAPAALPPFRYQDRGALATIGRHEAVALLPLGIRLDGVPAWLVWLFIHLLALVDFRSRFLVLGEWAWSYFTYERNARLILGPHGADAVPTDER